MVRRVGPNIRKVEIECHECPCFLLTDGRQRSVSSTPKVLVENRGRLMTGILEQLRNLDRAVLVYLEPHGLSYEGRETTRSRASSAA
jgi:hypothetical protein